MKKPFDEMRALDGQRLTIPESLVARGANIFLRSLGIPIKSSGAAAILEIPGSGIRTAYFEAWENPDFRVVVRVHSPFQIMESCALIRGQQLMLSRMHVPDQELVRAGRKAAETSWRSFYYAQPYPDMSEMLWLL